ARITQPMIRAGWLDRGPGPDSRRGSEPFVPVSWATAIDRLAHELRRVYDRCGGSGVYGGSYGWSSAGRFHHAQSQLHRFLNCLGGYVRGEHTYSNGAQSVIMPRVVGSMRDLLDRAFLARYCVGFERFEAYVLGATDGCPKTPEWAERLSEIPAASIRALARRMAGKRTLINVNYSLQRVEHGEQAPWLAVTLAAMLGQIGLPGGGFGQGYGSLGYIGRGPLRVGPPTLPQGRNPVTDFIPFARIADMLLHPGEPFDFDGQRLTFPGIRLVYWCGGNPFHHHQDLDRLRRALARPDTIVVHDSFWTPMARHADVVLPATMTLERNDLGGSPNDACLVAMRQAVEPWGAARSDFTIFADLATALGVAERFTEGRDEMAWLRHLYEEWRSRVADDGGAA